MTLDELKQRAQALVDEIQQCLDEDSEWTSPQGNGTNAFEAIEAAIAFNKLIQDTK